MNLGDYARLSAVDMARLVREGEASPVELVRGALAAIEATDPALNAWSEVFADAALSRAAELEAEARRGAFRGPLHGVPVGIKDLFQVKGTHTRRGSHLYARSMATETGPAVERLLSAGAVMVGKNTTPELGWKASSASPLTGVTRNPWDPSRTPGGSSSGSAVAVAAGTVPISLGSDGGGSLRVPASFCGAFSLKASLGRVPTWPLSPSEHLSHAGPITNTVADYALALDVLQGPDPRDPQSLPREAVDYLAATTQVPKRLRVVLAPTLFGLAVQPDIAACVAAAYGRMRREMDIDVVGTSLDWPDPIGIFDRLWTARGGAYHSLGAGDLARLDPGFARLIERSRAITIAEHLRTLQDRAAFNRRAEESFRDFDLLVTPMVPIDPFAAEADGPPDMDLSTPVPWARWTPFSAPFNITGQPAASIPCGWSNAGFPVGLQVIGPRFHDARVLQFCAAWERLFDWRSRRPAVFAGA
jgi:aspartyl-tRNA(Asn)/glutamyl-tRNA(Gln) amidotransferase subunit A